MKKIIPSLILALFALGACETIEVEKLIYDTVFVDRPQYLAPSFITIRDTVVVRDTVQTTVVVRDTIVNNVHTTDTVYQVVVKDSIIVKQVEKVVNHYDTIIQLVYDTIVNNIHTTDTIFKTVVLHDTVTLMTEVNRVIYLDTLYVVTLIRPVNSIPEELKPFVIEFYQLAGQYGYHPIGGVMIVQYSDNMPGNGWNSSSWDFGGQMIIEVNSVLPTAQHRAGVLRELSRLQLQKKYTVDESKILCPWFDPSTNITSQHLTDLFGRPI